MAHGLLPRSSHDPAAAPPFATAGYVRALLFAALTISIAGTTAAQAAPQEPKRSKHERLDLPTATVKAAPVIGGTQPEGPCVTVDIAGNKASSDCAAQALEAAAKAAQRSAAVTPDLPVPSATSRDVVTGVTNQAATRQRMGSNFGKSVRPQRPPPPVFAPPLRPKP